MDVSPRNDSSRYVLTQLKLYADSGNTVKIGGSRATVTRHTPQIGSSSLSTFEPNELRIVAFAERPKT